jgi:hypothetical protein
MSLYPASDQRSIYSPHGYALPNHAYTVYSDSAATVPATIYDNNNGVQGSAVANSRVFANQRSVIPQFHAMGTATLYGKPDGYAGPITALTPDPASALSLESRAAKSDLVVNVRDYGAKGDNVTNDDAAFAAALTAAGTGGAVRVPYGRYVLSTLAINDGQHIIGDGYYVNRDAVATIGMAAGYLAAGVVTGSALRLTNTTGNGVTHVKPSIHAGGGMRDIAVLGPGTGTSVGISFGNSTPRAVLAPVYRNVMVANFATGITMLHVNEGEFSSLLVKGCTTAISCVDDVNDVGWFKLNMQRCTNGLIQESGGLCYSNSFISPICQNITNFGFQLRGFSHTFTSPYFELCGPGTTGNNSMMSFANAQNCTVTSPQKQGAGTFTIDIASGSNFNHFLNLILSSTMLIANGGTGSFFTGNLDNGARITGSNNRVAVDLNSATYEVPSLSTTSGSRPSVQGTNFFYRNGTGGPIIQYGTGTPEGVVTAPIGSIFVRTNPTDVNTMLYLKITGAGNTGWLAK